MASDKTNKKTIGTERVKYDTVTLGGETSVGDEGSSTSITRSVTDKMLRTDGLSEKYVFVDEIGRGGMGSVLRVYDSNLRRHVAMKRILASTGERTRLRFVEEAQITGQLEHPHIVPVHEIGKDANDRLYFTMKLVRGDTLHEVLEKLREDPDASERYTLGHLLHAYINVCHAIDFAHSREVIHRDIKPENIMLGQFGEVQVMDWGLAKARHVERESASVEQIHDAVTVERQKLNVDADKNEVSPVDSARKDDMTGGITMDGQILGTLAYMPPEQARGDNEHVDKRSDIYSLGAILYEILTLHIPIVGTSNEDMIRKISRGNIELPSERTPERTIPRELEAICMKALARLQELRYQSVYELRHDVELYLSGRAVSAKRDSFYESFFKLISRNKAVSAVVLVSLISIIILGIFTATVRNNAVASQKSVEELEKWAKDVSKREWVEVHPERFDFARLNQNWQLYTDWSVPPVPVAEHDLPRYVGMDPNGMHVRTNEKQLTILYKGKIVGDVRLNYEVTWHGGSEGGFHAIIHGNGWHEGYVFQIGGWGNTKTRLVRADSDGQRFLDESDFTLVPGTTYQISAIKVANELSLIIDGAVILHAIEETKDVLTGGPYSHCGFISGNNSESVYHKVSISKLGEPIQVDILEVADRYMLKAQYHTARDLYQEVFESLTISERKQRARDGVERANEYLKLEKSLDSYREVFDTTWNNLSPKLWIEQKTLQLDMRGENIEDISVLRGMSIQRLNLFNCNKIKNIDALEGMPLQWLDISGTSVLDIAPLRAAPLTYLSINDCRITRGWVVLKFLPLVYLSMRGQDMKQLSPLAQNTTLQELDISGCQIHDLGPLADKPLHTLIAANNPIRDIMPLTLLPIKKLNLNRTSLLDLETMRLMPRLQQLEVSDTAIVDLSPLVQCDLFKLDISRTKVSTLQTISTLFLTELYIQQTQITDLSPLIDMRLKVIRLTPFNIALGLDVLRGMTSLEQIGIDDGPLMPVAEFWNLWDSQELMVPDFDQIDVITP